MDQISRMQHNYLKEGNCTFPICWRLLRYRDILCFLHPTVGESEINLKLHHCRVYDFNMANYDHCCMQIKYFGIRKAEFTSDIVFDDIETMLTTSAWLRL